MRILAIDPGPEQHAWVMWDTEKHDFWGPRMGLDVDNDIGKGPYDLVAIEFPQNYGINAGLSLFATACKAGMLAERYKEYEVAFFGRPSIKGQIGGRTDSEVNQSLRMRHGEARKGCKLEGVKKDIWAALALAVALGENPNLRRVEI